MGLVELGLIVECPHCKGWFVAPHDCSKRYDPCANLSPRTNTGPSDERTGHA